MEEYTLTVKSPLGMHARPAGRLVKLSKAFHSTIQLTRGDKTVDVKHILAVMGMGVKQGDTISFTVSGEDEREAMEQIKEICAEIL